MKKSMKKVLSLLLALSLLLSTGLTASAKSGSDIAGHWAQENLQSWIEEGLLKGFEDGSVRPNDQISRAEFIALVNRVSGYSEKADDISQFTDVAKDKWYADDIAIAVKAGYINGTGASTMSPDSPITREQAVAIVSRMNNLTLAGETETVLNRAVDGSAVSQWAQADVAKAMENGFVTGSEGMINPKAAITRAETVTLLERVRSNVRVFAFEGSYGPEAGTMMANDVIITAAGVSLQNVEIANNLQIAASVGDGDVYLDQVVVKGDLLVNGGGENSLYFSNITVEGSIVVKKDDAGNVRIVASGNCNVNVVVLESGAILVTQEMEGGGIKEVIISADFIGEGDVKLIGTFNTVTNNDADANIVMENAKITTLNLNAAAEVSGTGTITTANISEAAGDSSTLSVTPKTIIGAGADNVTITSGTTASSSSSSSSSNDNNNSTTTSKEIKAVASYSNEQVAMGETYAFPSTAVVTYTDNSTATLPVTWPTLETRNAGTTSSGSFNYYGKVTLADGITNPSELTVELTLEVVAELEEMQINRPASNLNIPEGVDVDLTGLSVLGTYSDGSLEVLDIADEDVSFDNTTDGMITVTITKESLTDSFVVSTYEVTTGEVLGAGMIMPMSAPMPAPITLPYMTEVTTSAALYLPDYVLAVMQDFSMTILPVEWDMAAMAADYDATITEGQLIVVTGRAQLNPGQEVTTDAVLDVSTLALIEPKVNTVAFDLNWPDASSSITKRVVDGGTVTLPTDPQSVTHNFLGWFEDMDGEMTFTTDTAIDADLTLYAGWTEKATPHPAENYLDSYFKSGSPYATVEDGQVVVYFELNNAAEVFVGGTAYGDEIWDATVEGVLHGHEDLVNGAASEYVNAMNYTGYADAAADTLIRLETDLQPYDSEDLIKLYFVIKDDSASYLSTQATKVVFSEDIMEEIYEDDHVSGFYEAYINAAETEVYLYFYEALDTTSVPAAADFRLFNIGDDSTDGTVTAVAVNNSTDGNDAWIKLTVSGIMDAANLGVEYTKGSNAIKDLVGNEDSSEQIYVDETSVAITEVNVNAAQGYMAVVIEENYNTAVDGWPEDEDFAFTNNGVAMDVVFHGSSSSDDYAVLYFEFDPIASATPNIGVTYAPVGGAHTWAMDPITSLIFSGTVNYISNPDLTAVTALYASDDMEYYYGNSYIELDFGSVVGLCETWGQPLCAYTVNINGTNYQLRGSNVVVDMDLDTARINMDDVRLPQIDSEDIITITYAPHITDSWEILKDASGAPIGDFGPVEVVYTTVPMFD